MYEGESRERRRRQKPEAAKSKEKSSKVCKYASRYQVGKMFLLLTAALLAIATF